MNAVRELIKASKGTRKQGAAGALDSMVPVIGIIATFGLLALIVGFIFLYKYKRRQLVHQSLSQMI